MILTYNFAMFHMTSAVHLMSCSDDTNENHENWYLMNKDEFTLGLY